MNLPNNNVKYVEEKRSQALRLNEPELRLFEQKLKNAFIVKELACQIKEKEYNDVQEKIRCRRDANNLIEAYTRNLEMQKNELQEISESKKEYGHLLQKQIHLNQLYKTMQKQEMVAEIKQYKEQSNLEDDRNKLIFNKTARNILSQKEMIYSIHAKQVIDLKEKLNISKENKAIADYQKYEEQKHKKIIEENNKKAEIRKNIYDIITSNMLEQKLLEDEKKQLVKELQDYDYINREGLDRKSSNKKLFQKELINALNLQIESNIYRAEQLKISEISYRKQLLQKIEDEEVTQSKNKMTSKLNTDNYMLHLNQQIHDDIEKSKNQLELIKLTDIHIQQYNDAMKEKVNLEKIKIQREYKLK